MKSFLTHTILLFLAIQPLSGLALSLPAEAPAAAAGTKLPGAPPVLVGLHAKLSSPDTIVVEYKITDPDDDLKTWDISVNCNGGYCRYELVEKQPSYSVIRACLGRTLTIRLTAEDARGHKTVDSTTVTTGARHADTDGYEWVSGGNRDALLNKRFPDLKVFVDIVDRPFNENGALSDSEIRQGVKLGLAAWASILPDMHLRFVDSLPGADFVIHFKRITYRNASGISLLAWDGERPGELTIDINDIAFRKLDFISPRMNFERSRAVFAAGKKVWSYYDDPEYISYCLNYNDAKEKIRKSGKDPEKVCVDWVCINWDSIPYADLIGKGREGNHDLAWLVQHEFGHVLGLGHVDMDDPLRRRSCVPFSCTAAQRSGDRHPFNDTTEKYWIPRAGLRKNRLPGITAKSSPSIMIGNGWGVGGVGLRGGIFDLDADALSTGRVDWCSCKGDKNRGSGFTGFKVSYPLIRPGWLIVVQHKTTGVKYYTNDWHVAHEKLGWIQNENTRPLDTEWFLIDILDPDEIAARRGERR